MNYQTNSIHLFSKDFVRAEKKIQEVSQEGGYKILVNYPYTPYSILNQMLDNFIEATICEFQKNIGQNPISSVHYYTLMVNYDSYFYENYISYVFYIFEDVGGAHPNTTIHTINYNSKEQRVITIDTLVQENPNILNILSRESVKQIQNSGKFGQEEYENIKDMILDGTRAVPKNFRNFAFSDEGLLLFFENYQVAPYVYGSFQVMIPYSLLQF